MKLFKESIFFIGLFLLAFIPTSVNAFVVEQLEVEFLDDFVLEPTKTEVLVDPGEKESKRLSVTNRTERVVDFQIEIEDITGSDNPEDQVKLLGNEKGPYSLKDFLIPEVKSFSLNPGERATVNIDVSLPEDVSPGGYYGAILVSAEDRSTDDAENSAGIAKIVTRLGSIFLVRVNGEANESSSLSTFKPVGPTQMIYSNHPEGFEVAIKNEGNVHLVHYGQVVVENMFGKKVKSIPIDAFFSLPESTRFKEALWPESFAFGYYTANLEIYKGYGPGDSFENSSVSFWVLPWQIVLPIVIAIIILILIINFIKKNFEVKKRG